MLNVLLAMVLVSVLLVRVLVNLALVILMIIPERINLAVTVLHAMVLVIVNLAMEKGV
jgi:hypothetical protein